MINVKYIFFISNDCNFDSIIYSDDKLSIDDIIKNELLDTIDNSHINHMQSL